MIGKGPLERLKTAEGAWVMAGLFAAPLLGELRAEVIEIGERGTA
jgi:crotonobetainyl-CoA:carnitine CoA-transferase CaiB-like acyl-CoA transferase